ncbi:hypothetical protein [Pseudomonas sp. RW10S2]|uniref:hypothetical protein n=1 Tax=Pseudomonas TaxID=286 RepID=UPI0016472002|nr:hypothetical protein [Pseudomonas sp. RW10S2]MBC3464445.1 hypothetical protein [Pseudomonas sp. RW10S2]QXI43843.1 hypothetical protein HU734_003370 [Pseudomonas wayambapalatensis]
MVFKTLALLLSVVVLPAHAFIVPRPYPGKAAPAPRVSMMVDYADSKAKIDHAGDFLTPDWNASFAVDDESRGRLWFLEKAFGGKNFKESVTLTSGGKRCKFTLRFDASSREVRASTTSSGSELADCRSSIEMNGEVLDVRFTMN